MRLELGFLLEEGFGSSMRYVHLFRPYLPHFEVCSLVQAISSSLEVCSLVQVISSSYEACFPCFWACLKAKEKERLDDDGLMPKYFITSYNYSKKRFFYIEMLTWWGIFNCFRGSLIL